MLFSIFSIIYLLLFIISARHKDDTRSLDKKMYPLKNLLHVGLFLQKLITPAYISDYSKKQKIRLGQISDYKSSEFYLKIFWAEKTVCLLAATYFIVLVLSFTSTDTTVFIFFLIILFIAWYLPDAQVDGKIKKRRKCIELAFPEFVLKISLLMGAGLSVMNSIRRISDEIDDKKNISVFQNELLQTISELNSGTNETAALENLAKRLRTPIITRFISLLIQNMEKGNRDIHSTLRLFGNESWEMRKNAVRKMGEEASTKLLLPILMMFAAILMIVLTPVLMAFNDI